MAKKKQPKEVSRKEINGAIIITFDDGSIQIIPAPITLTSDEADEHDTRDTTSIAAARVNVRSFFMMFDLPMYFFEFDGIIIPSSA